MILHFDQAKVRALLAHALAAPDHRLTFGQQLDNRPPTPGLWLVADEGVYLMSNGLPPLTAPDHVVYADETDPQKVDPATMDDVKRQSSGGDDSVEFLDAASVQAAIDTYLPSERYELDVTPEGIGMPAFQVTTNRPSPAFQAADAVRKAQAGVRKAPARKRASTRRPKSD